MVLSKNPRKSNGSSSAYFDDHLVFACHISGSKPPLRPQTFLARLRHTVQSTYLHQWVSRPFLRRTVGRDSTSKFKDFLPTKVRKWIKNWQLWAEIGAFDWTVDVPCEVRKGRITRWSPLQSCKVLPTASWNHAATFVSFLKRVHGLEYNLDISLISFAQQELSWDYPLVI